MLFAIHVAANFVRCQFLAEKNVSRFHKPEKNPAWVYVHTVSNRSPTFSAVT